MLVAGRGLLFVGRSFPDALCTVPCVGRDDSARHPLCRGGLGPPGGLVAHQGAESLRGERPFLFLRKKKRSFTPKKKLGPGLRWVSGRSRRLTSLRTVVRTSPGRYGHAIVEQGQAVVLSCGRLAVPLSRQSALAVHRGRRAPHKSSTPPQGRHLTTPALREAPAGGGWLERKLSLFPNGRP